MVFLLFTLGLEFSWPRMVALRREVFGLGSLQVFGTAAVVALIARLFGLGWAQSIVIGGVVAMSSTVLIVQQLTERAELNRTHGRLAFSVVLFQDIAVVPFLALAAALAPGRRIFTVSHGAQAGRRGHRRGARGAGRGPLAAAAAALRHRQQPPARAVHARGAAGRAGLRLGFADGRPVDGARRASSRA